MFSIIILQSSVSHDPSEIILICRFAAQKNIIIIIIVVKNSGADFFSGFLINRKFRRIAFIWNRNICNIINVFIITFLI